MCSVVCKCVCCDKLKENITYVYKEYEIKIKMVQEQ